MREIKFRAWDNKNKVMWDEGVYISLDGELSFDKSKMITGYNPFEFVLMQSTCLKDKNGKEIYEGDLIKNEWCDGDNSHEVFYDVKECKFTTKCVRVNESCEVIGNIYENPELLKG